jgi:hypothetical protein
MLDEALLKAKEEQKRVFLILSASWCGPCRLLSRFIAAEKAELEQHYVFVKLDISRDAHADALRQRFKESQNSGVPWFAVLDPDGSVQITSNAPEVNPMYGTSNIGFPAAPKEIDHFMTILKQTAPRLSAERLEGLRNVLSKKK